jgi:hypothetical protein
MSRFSAAERVEIAARTLRNIQRGHSKDVRRRDDLRIVTKTFDNARVDPPAPVQEETTPADANATAWAAWVEDKIEAKLNSVVEGVVVLSEAVAKLSESSATHRKKHERAIEALGHRLDIEVALGKKIARMKAEIAEARAQQPNFENQLSELREENARQKQQIVRLRAEQSQLRYGQKKLESEQQHGRQQLKVTSIEVSNIGGATRTMLERLQQEGLDLDAQYYARPN